MKALKVFLFMLLLYLVSYGLMMVFTANSEATRPEDAAAIRIMTMPIFGFAVAIWYAFRDPVRNVVVIRAIITWMGLEALILAYNLITGDQAASNTVPGIITDVVIVAMLIIFYLRAKEVVKPL